MSRPQCSIWIEEKDFDKITTKIKSHYEEDAFYEGHELNELYIDKKDGHMGGFITVGDIGVSISIPFEEWFSEFIRLRSFENMFAFMDDHKEKLEEAMDETCAVLDKIDEVKETK